MSDKEIAMERFVIPRATGPYLRRAALLVKAARQCDSKIMIKWGDETVDGKNLMNLLPIFSQHGAIITVMAKGGDACEALQSIEAVFNTGFLEGGLNT